MIWLFLLVGAVLVVTVGFVAVGSAVGRLERSASPAVFEVDDAVDWVAERLPEEAATVLRRDEVVEVVGWWLEFVADAGLSTEYGQELGEEALRSTDGDTVADLDAAVDHVVARSLDRPDPLDEVAVVVVLDLLVTYLGEVGVIGGRAGERE